jgi:serine/threonine-protein kinase
MVAGLLSLPATCGRDRLSAELTRSGLSRRDLPGIIELFGHRGELWQLTPAVRQRELFAATIRLFKTATRRGRVLLIFENVDRYDQPSQELLHQLCQVGDDSPLRVLITLGPERAADWPEATTRVDLSPLDRHDLDAMAGYLALTGVEGMPDAVQLTTHTSCQPGHIHHLVRFVVEGGGVERAPRSMADLIAERVKSLPYPARVLCQAAAIFGVEAPRSIVVQALGERLSAFDQALSVLKARGLVHDRQGGAVLAFSGQLVRDVVYDAIPAELRRELHTAAAAVLESATSDALVLGHHQYLAGDLAAAVHNLERAGDHAVHQLDDSGATHLYHRAQNAARALMLADDDAERRAVFVTLSAKLADALRLGGQGSLARGIVEEARDYSQGSPRLEAQLLRASAHLSLSEGKLDAAIAAMGRGIGLLIQAGASQLLAEMYLDLSAMHVRNDDVPRAIAELSEGLDLITMGEGHGAAQGPAILWRVLLRLAQLHGEVGHARDAVALASSALAHAQRVGSHIGSARAQAMLAVHYERAGDAERARHYRDAAVDELRRLGDRRGTAELLLGSGLPNQSLLHVDPANLCEARELADEVGWSEGVELAQEKITKNRSVPLS